MIVILGFGMLSFPHQHIVSTQLHFFCMLLLLSLLRNLRLRRVHVLWFAVKVADAHFFRRQTY
jgi:hypothetical protein